MSGDYISVAGKSGIPNDGAWLVMQMDVARPIGKYTYHTRVDATDGIAKSWHVMYSLNGTDYFSVDNQVNLSLGINTSFSATFPAVVAKYWGIQIYKVDGTGTVSITQELTFFP